MAWSDRNGRGAAVRDIDLRSWFAESELESCPRCQRQSALPTPSGGVRVCLGCGLVTPAGKRIQDLRPRLADAA